MAARRTTTVTTTDDAPVRKPRKKAAPRKQTARRKPIDLAPVPAGETPSFRVETTTGNANHGGVSAVHAIRYPTPGASSMGGVHVSVPLGAKEEYMRLVLDGVDHETKVRAALDAIGREYSVTQLTDGKRVVTI